MSTAEQSLRRWQDAARPLRADAIEAAAGAYIDALGTNISPSDADVQAARDAAAIALKRSVTSDRWISALAGNVDDARRAAITLQFNDACADPPIPAPHVTEELPPSRLALAAAVGAVAGTLLITPITEYLLRMPDVGLLVGPPIGAFAMVLAIWQSARNKWLRRSLMVALGVATVAEVYLMFRGGLLGGLWRKLGGKRGGLKRVALYVAILFVLLLARPRPRIDRARQERVVRATVEQWLDGATITLGLLASAARDVQDEDDHAVLAALAQRAMSLGDLPAEQLPAAVEEFGQELRNLGFEASADDEHAMIWQDDCAERYKTFGLVEAGDEVIVERQAVIFHGQVRSKGLVRKRRERT